MGQTGRPALPVPYVRPKLTRGAGRLTVSKYNAANPGTRPPLMERPWAQRVTCFEINEGLTLKPKFLIKATMIHAIGGLYDKCLLFNLQARLTNDNQKWAFGCTPDWSNPNLVIRSVWRRNFMFLIFQRQSLSIIFCTGPIWTRILCMSVPQCPRATHI